MVTGLVFARFSRPVADILFSQNAVMSWMGNLRSFEFRIINTRNNQIIDLHVRLLVSRFETNASGAAVRRYYPLNLERESVVFFPLSWTDRSHHRQRQPAVTELRKMSCAPVARSF